MKKQKVWVLVYTPDEESHVILGVYGSAVAARRARITYNRECGASIANMGWIWFHLDAYPGSES